MRKLPIGIQDFEKIRQNDFLYVDKTKYVYCIIKIPNVAASIPECCMRNFPIVAEDCLVPLQSHGYA